jgi:hypothetical protein
MLCRGIARPGNVAHVPIDRGPATWCGAPVGFTKAMGMALAEHACRNGFERRPATEPSQIN